MPCWYFEKRELRNTASIRDGMTFEEEGLCRKQGAQFIIDLGYKMGMLPETVSTGVLFFHRFYVFQSFKKYPKYVMATCCLFLAGKVEETPKKLKAILKAARSLLDETDRPDEKKEFGEDQRGDVVAYYERVLLPNVKFDFLVESPYRYLKKYAKTIKGSREQIKKMLQMAWTFINDSFGTTLCLQWEPEIIAIAVMYLASKLSKFEITDWEGKQENSTKKWWEQFVEHLSIDILEDICHQVLDLLTSPPSKDESDATPTQANDKPVAASPVASTITPSMSVCATQPVQLPITYQPAAAAAAVTNMPLTPLPIPPPPPPPIGEPPAVSPFPSPSMPVPPPTIRQGFAPVNMLPPNPPGGGGVIPFPSAPLPQTTMMFHQSVAPPQNSPIMVNPPIIDANPFNKMQERQPHVIHRPYIPQQQSAFIPPTIPSAPRAPMVPSPHFRYPRMPPMHQQHHIRGAGGHMRGRM